MSFGEVLSLSGSLALDWAWLIFPLITFHITWYIWVRYRELIMGIKAYKEFVYLHIHLPKEIEATPKSMEQVFHSFHGMVGFVRTFDKILWRDRQPWFSMEMVGMNGSLFFMVVVEKKRRGIIESALYSEYPDIEIEDAGDYTLTLPLDLPNEDWDIRGYDWVLGAEDIWQIKTYTDWENDKEIEALRKIDPIAQWAEVCTSLKPGEYLWLQFILSPINSNENGWLKRAQAVRNEFDRRSPKEKGVGEQIVDGIGDFLKILAGQEPGREDRQDEKLRFPTTLEVNAVKALGSKLERPVFDVNIRAMYVAQRDIYSRDRHAALRAYIRPFADFTNNYFRAHEKTETRVRYFVNFLEQFRSDLRRRRFIWYYRMRFIRQEEPKVGQFGFSEENLIYRLNALELATMIHFPGKEVAAPGLRRLPFRKTKPPVELPTI